MSTFAYNQKSKQISCHQAESTKVFVLKAKITKRTKFLISRCLALYMRESFGKTHSFVAIEREEESKKLKMLIIVKRTQFYWISGGQ